MLSPYWPLEAQKNLILLNENCPDFSIARTSWIVISSLKQSWTVTLQNRILHVFLKLSVYNYILYDDCQTVFFIDLIPEGTVVICPSKNLSKEVNKENQKPLSLSDAHIEIESQLSISSDEIEEGEIISSDEDEEKSKSEGHSENPQKSRPKTSPETRNLTSSPRNQKNKTIHCN